MNTVVFSGNCAHSIDPKSRVTIPAAYRDLLGEDFTLSINSQLTALALYPKDEWEKISEGFSRIPLSDARGMAYVRFMTAFSYPHQSLDKAGRLLLPQTLRSKVGLNQKIYFVGAMHSLEIWDEAAFEKFAAATEESFADLMGYVNDRYYSES